MYVLFNILNLQKIKFQCIATYEILLIINKNPPLLQVDCSIFLVILLCIFYIEINKIVFSFNVMPRGKLFGCTHFILHYCSRGFCCIKTNKICECFFNNNNKKRNYQNNMERNFINVIVLGFAFMFLFTAFQTMGNVEVSIFVYFAYLCLLFIIIYNCRSK